MLINYNQFEIISPFKNYRIDHEHNKNLLKTLEEFSYVSKNTNLKYYLSGSACISFLTNKIYRTWTDIDIFIEEDLMFEWLELFPRQNWFYESFNKDVLKLYNNNYYNYIELNTGDHRAKEYKKQNLIITDYYGIKIGDLHSILFWKKNFRQKLKQIDLDDQIIIRDYLNI
jgi:hypothetical protein